MVENNIYFVLLLVSTLLTLLLDIYIVGMRNKKQIHYSFLGLITSMFLWNFSVLIQMYFVNYGLSIESNELWVLLEQLYFTGVIGVAMSQLFTGIIFSKTKIKFNWKYMLLFVIPAISLLLLFTNEYHHLFMIKYSLISSEIIYGKYFIVHTVYSYLSIIIGLWFLVYSSIKNSGFFNKQSLLIFWGTVIPFLIDTLSTFKIVDAPVVIENIAISIAIVCYFFAIIKFGFLNVIPIALQKVVDHISDGFIVVNEAFEIIDYNMTFINTFGSVFNIKRKSNFISTLENATEHNIGTNDFILNMRKVMENEASISFEKHFRINDSDRYFSIEMTPLVSEVKSRLSDRKKSHSTVRAILGIIVLFKDITQNVKNLETIMENQAILVEQERLASLGQLIGGIAHNLKTPIMSISGGIEAVKDLVYEYRDSIDDKSVTEQDHKEIARDMLIWLEKIKPYCGYMSDVISAVKGQAVQMNSSMSEKFTVDELIKRVDLLMKHELKKYHCILKLDSQIDMRTEIKGEVNNLVQVFDNIIINAVHAYEGNTGTIDLKIVRSGDNVEFIFRDYGKGIPGEITDRLFKEMVTTKGRNGTGLGLYMSYSTIRGRFGGNISFTSKVGAGTTFYISIPCITYNQREAS